MPVRIEKRLVIALPIRVYGMGSDGKPFNQEARTLDITRDGARIDGLPQITAGETVGVQYGENKARYKVIWVGEAGGNKEGQIGVQVVEPGPSVWHKILEATPEEARWVNPAQAPPSVAAVVKNPPAGPSPANTLIKNSSAQPPPPANAISQRVEEATEE